MLRAAVTPRMLALLLLLLVAAAVCARLGAWQLDRAQIRGAERAAAAQAEQDANPVALTDLLEPQSRFPAQEVGRLVTVRGTYEPEGQLLVVGRVLDGRPGQLVLTPLRVADERSAPVLPVVRGWVPAGAAGTGEPDVPASALEPPAGTVELSGYLQAGEAAGDHGLPPGQTDSISSGALLNEWEGPIYTGYLVLAASEPDQADALALLPRPTDRDSGLNVQNVAYAIQWWIFSAFAVALWLRLVRDEARDAVERRDSTGPVGGATVPEPGARRGTIV